MAVNSINTTTLLRNEPPKAKVQQTDTGGGKSGGQSSTRDTVRLSALGAQLPRAASPLEEDAPSLSLAARTEQLRQKLAQDLTAALEKADLSPEGRLKLAVEQDGTIQVPGEDIPKDVSGLVNDSELASTIRALATHVRAEHTALSERPAPSRSGVQAYQQHAAPARPELTGPVYISLMGNRIFTSLNDDL